MNDSKKISLVIADDHDIYRDGLCNLLAKDPQLQVVAEAASGKKLIEAASALQPDIVLTDLRMPEIDGVLAIAALVREFPAMGCIALSSFGTEHMIVDALEAGARGYVTKNAQRGEIIDAVKTVANGNPYYCRPTSRQLITLISDNRFSAHGNEEPLQFSSRELDIVRLICQDKSNKEIGESLYMSPRTVEGIRAKILDKMKVKTAAGIAIYAVKHALVRLS